MLTSIGHEVMSIGEIDVFLQRNASRLSAPWFADDAEKSRLISCFIPEMWNSSLGKPKVVFLSKAEQETAVEALKVEHKRLLDSEQKLEYRGGDGGKFNIPASIRLRAWESLHLDSKGKVIVPKVKAILCLRRLSLYADIVAVAMMKDIKVNTDVPVEIVEGSELDFYSANLQENILKTAGAKEISSKDLLLAIELVYKEGATTEADIIRAIGGPANGGRGKGQWGKSFWDCDTAYPEFKLGEKLKANVISPPKIGGKERMRQLATQGATTEDLVDFFCKGEVVKKVKSTTPKQMEEFAKRHKANLMVAHIFGALLVNDLGAISKNADGDLLQPHEVEKLGEAITLVYHKSPVRDEWLAQIQNTKEQEKAAS